MPLTSMPPGPSIPSGPELQPTLISAALSGVSKRLETRSSTPAPIVRALAYAETRSTRRSSNASAR